MRLCHSILKFSQKSGLRKIASTLSDTALKSFQAELEIRMNSVKEELSLVLAKRADEESQENARFRIFSTKSSTRTSEQYKLERYIRILNQCSVFDYETPWKQARKSGNSRLFLSNSDYHVWKDESKSCTLVYTGKLGSGKTVLLANMVDGLHLHAQTAIAPVAYFFCRHDISDSLRARTVIGVLARQLLQTTTSITTRDMPADEFLISNDIKGIVKLIQTIIPASTKAYFILDGSDDLSKSEREALFEYLRELQQSFTLHICVSHRIKPDSKVQLSEGSFMDMRLTAIPEDNPEIIEFIEFELRKCIGSGELALGDPILATEIQQTLERKAQGMFLWVILQIKTLCTMQSDRTIRLALANLPRGLSETFSRILNEAGRLAEPVSQRRILQFVVVAQRPLTLHELREALSITEGRTTWDRTALPNHIYATLACCGCLLIVDDEDLTVRLVHKSVKQYLLNISRTPPDIAFTFDNAQKTMLGVIVTYLSYGTFDRRLSTLVVSQMGAGLAPSAILDSALEPGWMKSAALMFLRPKQSPTCDISKTLVEARNRALSHGKHPFHFHEYARPHWVSHLISCRNLDSSIYKLLLRLFEDSKISLDDTDDNGRASLRTAILKGPRDISKLLLIYGQAEALFKTEGDQSLTLLFLAARTGYRDIFGLLFKLHNIDVTTEICFGRTLLSCAAENGHVRLVDFLLGDREVDVDQQDSDGRTALSWAAAEGHEAVAWTLLIAGASPRINDSRNRSPIGWAYSKGYNNIVKLLRDTSNTDSIKFEDYVDATNTTVFE